MTYKSPEGWFRVSLDEVAEAKNYGFTASATSSSGGPKFLRITDLVNGNSWEQVPYSDSRPKNADKFRLRDGDVVICRTGANVGIAVELSNPPDAIFASYLVRFRFDRDRVAKRFIGFLLSSPSWRDHVQAQKSGSGQPQFNASLMGQFAFDLPPLDEQRRIAGVLGALDDKISTNAASINLLDEITRNLFWSRFGLKLSQGKMSPLSEIVTTQYGLTASAQEDQVGPKFLRVKDINKRNWIDWHDVPFCPTENADRKKYGLNVGDVVVARMADPGKAAIVESEVDAVFASYLVRLKTEDLASSYFVYGFLKSPIYEAYTVAAKSGSVQQNMNAKVIAGVELSIPEKSAMNDHLEEVLPLRKELASLNKENQLLAQMKDELTPKLVSGQVRVPDTYDPTGVLEELVSETRSREAKEARG